jgi:hypothetical protein
LYFFALACDNESEVHRLRGFVSASQAIQTRKAAATLIAGLPRGIVSNPGDSDSAAAWLDRPMKFAVSATGSAVASTPAKYVSLRGY